MLDAAFYTALAAQIGDLDAYPILAAKNATAPFVVYQRMSTVTDRTSEGESGRKESLYRIDVYHSDAEQAEVISDQIATGLLNYTTAPIRYIYIEDQHNASDISGDPSLYRYIVEARVIFSA